MLRSLSVGLFLVVAASCGDSQKDGDNSMPDAPVVANDVTQALVVSGDFDMSGVMSRLDLETITMHQNVASVGVVSGDPVLRHIGNRIYVINRSATSSITVLDANTLELIEQYGTGAGSNPQDVAVAGNSLYVPALGTAGVIKISTSNGAMSTIDLSSLDPADGHPDCVSAYAVGNKVYVSCGTLDEFFSARGPGKVAVINANDDTLATTVTLPANNPYNFIVQSPPGSVFAGDLLVPLLPSFTNYSMGCIARVSTGASPTAACAAGLANSDIAGTVIHMDVAPEGSMLWMAVGTLDQNFMNPTGSLKGLNLMTGTLLSASVSPSSQMIQDVAACPDGSVVVADGTFGASGLRVYRESAEVTTAVQAIGLPPTFGNAVVCYDAAQP
jgi:hypothetical protein